MRKHDARQNFIDILRMFGPKIFEGLGLHFFRKFVTGFFLAMKKFFTLNGLIWIFEPLEIVVILATF